MEQVSLTIQWMFLNLIVLFIRLQISSSAKYVTAQLIHFENGPVVEASTSEWCIKKQLYNTKDTAAYVNLARVSPHFIDVIFI